MELWAAWTSEEWKTLRYLGKGSGGSVYEIQREMDGRIQKAAMKVIRIPQDPEETKKLLEEGMSPGAIKDAYAFQVRKIRERLGQLSGLRGSEIVAAWEAYEIVEDPDENGWTIYMRTELLKSAKTYFEEHFFSEERVKEAGRDILKGLMICHEKKILHENIRLENIFMNDRGGFVLGDFGVQPYTKERVQKQIEAGTAESMAPQVLEQGTYDQAAELYAAGIVVYSLLNKMRGPFMPLYGLLMPEEARKALEERRSGKPIPDPVYGSREIRETVKTALAFEPEERFPNAEAFYKALTGEDAEKISAGAYRKDSPAQPQVQSACVDENAEKAKEDIWEDSRRREKERDRSEEKRTKPVRKAEPDKERERNLAQTGKRGKAQIRNSKRNRIFLCVILLAAGLAVMFSMLKQSEPEDIQKYISEAEAGDSEAMYHAGLMYKKGKDVEKDLTAAAEWFEIAAEEGNVQAMIEIAGMYENGEGVGQDYVKALRWYKKAESVRYDYLRKKLPDYYYEQMMAEDGDSFYMYCVGRDYLWGEGGAERDYAKALEWFQKGSKIGDPYCLYELGDMYLHGLYVEQDYELALECIRKAAEMDNWIAFLELSLLYEQGIGVEQDMELSGEWYQKSVEKEGEENAEELMELVRELYEIYEREAERAKLHTDEKEPASVSQVE